MKRILLPTDFSENAANAISYAVQLFKEEECIFYLLNTYTPAAYHTGMMVDSYSALQLEDITRKNSLKGLDRIEKELIKEYNNPKHKFEKLSSFNLLVSEITSAIETYSLDLIIMGTQGATGAKEVFLGTHTMYTIKKAKCPVIAVPSGFTFHTPKEILFATDFRFHTTNKYLHILKDICELHVSRLNILNAYYGVPLDADQNITKDYLDEYFKDNAHLLHMSIGIDVVEAVEAFQVRSKINFLVMIHNKHSFFENLLFKPVINDFVFHTKVPFLVIPSEDRLK